MAAAALDDVHGHAAHTLDASPAMDDAVLTAAAMIATYITGTGR